MNKCLVTKLKGIVQNNELLRIGELRIPFHVDDTLDVASIKITCSEDSVLTISGNGYFTNEEGNENKGVSLNIQTDSDNEVFMKGTDFYLSVPNKYVVKKLSLGENITMFDINDIAYSKNLELLECGAPGITGDIKALKDLFSLRAFVLNNSTVFGDISNLNNTSLVEMHISNSANLKGDLSLLPNTLLYIAGTNSPSNIYSWKNERPASANIIALNGLIIQDVDAMLINQAKCKKAFNENDAYYYKSILISGNRTAASDNAIQVLQGKGYTISINPITI